MPRKRKILFTPSLPPVFSDIVFFAAMSFFYSQDLRLFFPCIAG